MKETWPYKDNKDMLQQAEKKTRKKTYVCLALCVYMFWLLSCATRRKPEKLNQIHWIRQKKKEKEWSKWETDRGMTDRSIFSILSHYFRDLHEDSHPKAFFVIQHVSLRSKNNGRTGGNLSVSIVSSPPSFTSKFWKEHQHELSAYIC